MRSAFNIVHHMPIPLFVVKMFCRKVKSGKFFLQNIMTNISQMKNVIDLIENAMMTLLLLSQCMY